MSYFLIRFYFIHAELHIEIETIKNRKILSNEIYVLSYYTYNLKF